MSVLRSMFTYPFKSQTATDTRSLSSLGSTWRARPSPKLQRYAEGLVVVLWGLSVPTMLWLGAWIA